jgi:hypothetical protein
MCMQLIWVYNRYNDKPTPGVTGLAFASSLTIGLSSALFCKKNSLRVMTCVPLLFARWWLERRRNDVVVINIKFKHGK